jgi:hypothetical protein
MNQVGKKMMIQKTVFVRNYSRFLNNFSNYLLKILLGDFNAKVESENIFIPTIGNDCLHQDSNDNDVRIVIFVT